MIRPFRDVRTRLLLIVLGGLAVGLACATLAFDVLFTQTTSRNADAFLRARAASDLALVHVIHGHARPVELSDSRLGDSRLWIFDGLRLVEASVSRPATLAAARSLAGTTHRYLDVPATDDRLYSVPILSSAGRIGTLVTGVSLAPYESTRRTATIASGVLIAFALIMVGFAVWWMLRLALRPVELMTAQAAAWSEHDLDRRFGLGEPHDELTRLAATLDGLLDRLAASLRREQRFSAEISHELRTPLASLRAETDLALRRERTPEEYRTSLEVIARNAERLGRIVETLVATARQAATPQGTSDALAVARAVAGQYTRTAIEVRAVGGASGLRAGVDRELAERIVQPVVENAVHYGVERVSITVEREDHSILIRVEDDGPGVGADEAEAIFEPAIRGAAADDRPGGSGLGLSLARRLARATTGDIYVVPQAGGHFVIRLPHG